jgi:uncharacterized membrane protein
MQTTRRFSRTLAEAFPLDSQHRAEYGCAIQITGKPPFQWKETLQLASVCIAIGYVLGKMF